jgi:hypothetical protein
MLKNKRWKWLILTCVAVAAVGAGAVGLWRPASDVVLTDINNIAELSARFNQDKGTPRLVLLLSPT